jgi:phenylacetaldehyde dehydrogenase
VTGFLDAGEREGVRTVTGGKQVGERGDFVARTVLDRAGPGTKVFDEEIFGPVVTAIPFKDTAEVAAAANETIYGLAAGIWTNDLTKAHRLIPQLRRAPCGSTPTTSLTLRFRSVATNSPDGEERWAKR